MALSVAHVSAEARATGVSTLTINFTAATAGNLLVAVWRTADASNDTPVAPAGWTLVDQTLAVANPALMAYKIAAGGETSVTVANKVGTGTMSGYVYEVTGFGGTPTLDTHNTGTTAAATSASTPSITPTRDGSIVIAYCSVTAASGGWGAAPSGWTNATPGATSQSLAGYQVQGTAAAASESFSWTTSTASRQVIAAFRDTGVTVSPSGVASAEAFGTATVSTGPVELDPSGIASAEAFGADQLNQTVYDAAIASAEAFGAIAVGTPVFPSGIASAEAFGTDVVTTGPVTVSPSGIASAEAIGVATIQEILAAFGIASAEAFGVPVLSAGQVILSPPGIAPGAVGVPTLSPGPVVLSPFGIASAEAFGVTVVALVISPAGIVTAEAFGVPVLSMGPVTVSVLGIASAEAFGATRVIGTIAVVGIPSAEAFGVPTVALSTPSLYYIRAGFGVWYAGTDPDGTYRWGPLETAFGFRSPTDASAQAAAISSRASGLGAAPVSFFLGGTINEFLPASVDELIDKNILVGP